MSFKDYIQDSENDEINEASDDRKAVTTFKMILGIVKKMETEFNKSGQKMTIKRANARKLKDYATSLIELEQDLN